MDAMHVVTRCMLGGLSALLGCGDLDDRIPVVVTPTGSEGLQPSVAGAGGVGQPRGVDPETAGAGDRAAGAGSSDPAAGDGSTGGSSGGTAMGGTAGTEAAASSCSEPCPPGASCNGDTCQCPGVQTACPDGCFDLQTDLQHCGSCSTTCRYSCASGFCFNQLVVPTVSLNPEEFDFAVNATHVYFTRSQAGSVSRISLDGSDLQLVESGQVSPGLIKLDGNSVYWTVPGNIVRKVLNGGSPVELITSTEPDTLQPSDIAVNATAVFWTDSGLTPFIGRVPLEGGPPTLLASGEAIGYPRAIATDDTHVYWSSFSAGSMTVSKVPLDGGTVTVLASGLANVRDIALHAGQVYLVLNGGDVQSVARVGVEGGPVTTLAAIHATCIAVDSTGVYVGGAGQYQNSVIRYALDGEGETVLGAGAFFSSSIALDANSVYWTSALDGIRSTAKAP